MKSQLDSVDEQAWLQECYSISQEVADPTLAPVRIALHQQSKQSSLLAI